MDNFKISSFFVACNFYYGKTFFIININMSITNKIMVTVIILKINL